MPQKIARWDLRETVKWSRKNRLLAGLAAVFFAVAGVASTFGMFRWDTPFFNWSFAIFLWMAALFLLVQIVFGKKTNDTRNQSRYES